MLFFGVVLVWKWSSRCLLSRAASGRDIFHILHVEQTLDEWSVYGRVVRNKLGTLCVVVMYVL